jgi:hypothetical protein
MRGYASAADHARQVAAVKASLAQRPSVAPPARPDCDVRAAVSRNHWAHDPDRTTRHFHP